MKKKLTRSEAGKLGAEASKSITAKQKQERIDKYNLNPTLCRMCKQSFNYEKRNNKFCDRSCAASFNNLGKVKNGIASPKEKKCKTCNEIYPIYGANRDSQHCRKCIDKHEFSSKKELSEIKTDRTRRFFLIKKYGIKCFVCNNTTWNNKSIPIELDHIDGNSENNLEENLRLICPNCHAQTDNYKGKNIGKGRAKRKQRYHDGKSY